MNQFFYLNDGVGAQEIGDVQVSVTSYKTENSTLSVMLMCTTYIQYDVCVSPRPKHCIVYREQQLAGTITIVNNNQKM